MPWGPVFKPDPEGDFILNVSPKGPTYLPPGPTLARRNTLSAPVRPPLRLARDAASRDAAYREGAVVTTVTRAPRSAGLADHRRSLTFAAAYDVTPRSPRSGRSSVSPALRSPYVVQERSPRDGRFSTIPPPEPYLDLPPPEHVPIPQPQAYPFPVFIRDQRSAPPIVHDPDNGSSSRSEDDSEPPRVTVAESNQRRRRDREYRETARRRREQGTAGPPREEDAEYEHRRRHRHEPSARHSSSRSSAHHHGSSVPPPPPSPPIVRQSVSKKERDGSPRVTEVTKTTEYHRTYIRERSRNSARGAEHEPPAIVQRPHSRSTSVTRSSGAGSVDGQLSPVIQRARSRTDAQGYLTTPPLDAHSGQLLLEDSTADRARQLVEERVIFGDNGKRKTKQYHYN